MVREFGPAGDQCSGRSSLTRSRSNQSILIVCGKSQGARRLAAAASGAALGLDLSSAGCIKTESCCTGARGASLLELCGSSYRLSLGVATSMKGVLVGRGLRRRGELKLFESVIGSYCGDWRVIR